jgi:hypothetical protein
MSFISSRTAGFVAAACTLFIVGVCLETGPGRAVSNDEAAQVFGGQTPICYKWWVQTSCKVGDDCAMNVILYEMPEKGGKYAAHEETRTYCGTGENCGLYMKLRGCDFIEI